MSKNLPSEHTDKSDSLLLTLSKLLLPIKIFCSVFLLWVYYCICSFQLTDQDLQGLLMGFYYPDFRYKLMGCNGEVANMVSFSTNEQCLIPSLFVLTTSSLDSCKINYICLIHESKAQSHQSSFIMLHNIIYLTPFLNFSPMALISVAPLYASTPNGSSDSLSISCVITFFISLPYGCLSSLYSS